LQAKEAKHAGVKEDLTLTNRSNASTVNTGKWWQVMRNNYVRSFYLPEHEPMPSFYNSHYLSRSPPHCSQPTFCKCGREKDKDELYCDFCVTSIEVVSCASQRELTDNVYKALKPLICTQCDKRFADSLSLQTHETSSHSTSHFACEVTVNPKGMSINQLKAALRSRGLGTSGNKDILVRRLEGALSTES